MFDRSATPHRISRHDADASGASSRAGCLAVQLNFADGQKEPPRRIMLVPAGPKVAGVDGRTFLNDRPEQVVAAFNALGRLVPIDENHSQELLAPAGMPSPAVGWITGLEVEAGAIWAAVDWTPRGEELLASRAYRYISPAFFEEKNSGRIVRFTSAALTNNPNLSMPALNASATKEDETMDRDALLKLLGIAADADEATIKKAINSLKGSTTLGTDMVPSADLQAALNRATAAEAEVKKLHQAQEAAEAEKLVDQALEDGKVTPGSREHYLKLCASSGIDAVKALFASLTPNPLAKGANADTGLDDKKPGEAGKDGELSDQQKALCKEMGVTAEDYVKTLHAADAA